MWIVYYDRGLGRVGTEHYDDVNEFFAARKRHKSAGTYIGMNGFRFKIGDK